jgi:hypothetical protein
MNRQNQQNTSSQPINILFYSKQCKSCNIFINQCHKHNILKYFKLVCVDERINEFKEKGIKIVPTIYKQNHGKPLEGKDAFIWLETIINNAGAVGGVGGGVGGGGGGGGVGGGGGGGGGVGGGGGGGVGGSGVGGGGGVGGNIIKRNIVNNTQNVSNTNTGPVVKNILDGYLQDEMNGFSDTYALLLTDDPLPKTFANHNTDQEIYTAPEGPKIDCKTQKNMIRNLEIQRTKDL